MAADGESCPEVLDLDTSETCHSREPGSPMERRDSKAKLLRHLNSPAVTRSNSARSTLKKDKASPSVSGASVSSDSAVGGGASGGQCTHSLKLLDLEAELCSVKEELSRSLTREASLRRRVSDESKAKRRPEQSRPTEAPKSYGSDCGKSTVTRHSNSPASCGGVAVASPAGTVPNQPRPEQERILQNLNKFLNEEVLKLSRLLQENQQKQQTQAKALSGMEYSLESFKRDYVFLMQSSLRISCAEGPEQQEVYLYGGRRHKERVLSLLEESRRRNPTLPVYDRCSPCLCHVDPLGFRHFLTEEPLALHYICCQLHHHYSVCAADDHHHHWKEFLRANLHLSYLEPSKELKCLVRRGIPSSLRPRVWCLLYKARVQDLKDAKGSHYYNTLCTLAPDSTVVAQHKRQISLDLLRTMPNNIRFSDQNADGVRKMQEVLQAFCLHNPALGYCQGMNFLAGMCLLFMEPENAFWCLVAIAERYFPSGYFDLSLIGAQADQEVLKDLVREKLPTLHRHLAQLDIELCTVTLNWFLAIFFDVVPMETLLRIWDCFLLEGPKSLFRFSLAMLKLQESAILSKKDTVSVMRQLKSASKLTYDADALFQIAFEELEPFPRRKDIVAKQAYYYRCIQERNKKREAEKAALHAKESLFSEPEFSESSHDARAVYGSGSVIECAAVFDRDKLWVVHGHQGGAQVSKVSCEECIMYRLNREFDSRVMCIHALSDDVMLLGTLSHYLYGYSTRSRKLLWEVQLNDSVLSLCSQHDEAAKRVFAGLADGTVAVVENVNGIGSKPETFYLLVGSNPVTCLCLVDKRLWCACGNKMVILNARTLDSVDSFQTSCSTMDYISLVKEGQDGIWVTLRGSSVLQLWDPKALTCRLLFDIHTNVFAKWAKDDSSIPAASPFRITSLLPLESSVLVGTAEGSLIFYDVRARDSSSSSSSTEEPDCDTQIEKENPPESSADDVIDEVDIPYERERNDSGCYSANTANSLSRRASGSVPVELIPVGGETETSQSADEDQRNETESTWRRLLSTIYDEKVVENAEMCNSDDGETIEEETRVAKRLWINDGHAIADPEENGDCGLLNERQRSMSIGYSPPVGIYGTLLRDISKGSRRSHSISLSDIRLPGSNSRRRGMTISADDLEHWLNGESPPVSSSVTSGSYEFDDILVPYTEDENGEGLPELSLRDAETLLQTFRENNGFAEFMQDVKETNKETSISFAPTKTLKVRRDKDSNRESGGSWSSSLESDQLTSSANSYCNDDGSTPDALQVDSLLCTNDFLKPSECDHIGQLGSDTSSSLSATSEASYVFQLAIQEKIKLSDKPIKCLLETRFGGELCVVSCAGCYGDDEAVLRWTKEGKEKMWTNDPIVEVCPYTNTIRPSPFARSRMPRRSSLQVTLSAPPVMTSNSQKQSQSVLKTKSSRSASMNVGNGLAMMQSMFSRSLDKS